MLAPWEIRLLDAHGSAAADVLRLRDALAPQLADAAQADRDLESFLEAGDPALSLRQFLADPKALELLLQLGQISRYGFDVARQYPGNFWDIVQNRQSRRVWSRRALDGQLSADLAAVEAHHKHEGGWHIGGKARAAGGQRHGLLPMSTSHWRI